MCKKICYNNLKDTADMKFDVVLGNPPYQKHTEGNSQTHPIWPEFVKIAFSCTADNGCISLIHPGGWRNVAGAFNDIKNIILSQTPIHLEMRDFPEGVKTFGASTTYDWYVVKKHPHDGRLTSISDYDGVESSYCLKNLPFVPSRHFDELLALVASPLEQKVTILRDASTHHTQRPWVNKYSDGTYTTPCVYSVRTGDIPTLRYSERGGGGLGVPKLIWGNGVRKKPGVILDIDGVYALTEFAHALVDTPEDLPKIKEVMQSQEFKDIMSGCPDQNGNFNYKVLSCFKKNFWRLIK